MHKFHLNPRPVKVSIFILIALAFALTACAPAVAIEPTVEAAAESIETPAAVFSAVDIIDSVSREVVIDAPAARIVSLAPSITESLYAIGAGDLLVGRTEFCDYPEEASALPAIGGFSSSSISIEAITDLEPDLVIGGSIYQADLIDALESAGIQVIILEPNSIEEIMDSLQTLGAVTGHTTEASSLLDEMQTRIDTVTQVVETIPEEERVSVFYEVWNDPYMTTTNQTFIGELINMAGGVNIFADLSEDYPSISSEEVIEKDPQVILGPSNHSDQLSGEIIAEREGWGDLSAVQNGRIYIIDGNIVSRAGPRVVDALEAIAQALYPQSFGE
ncbi:ABC transporter substrate-binding protein [Pelolinea submarina]|uniref:Iron complex transport system substrate-binding protein n=1 Tax=Pelolinea submarina TaxID=913107 RepID=A0A347ZR69_9CHLR|nr:cobalamin-binding protein [Pelolinea submarina]REG11646.1 iron complex transport system substrate-binding protein [Pelolinea submarina]BBB47800.1 iron complex transport system substrate-binding protein [Pelolinea submarina]